MLATTKARIREASRIAGEVLFGVLVCVTALVYILAIPRVLISGFAGFWFFGPWGSVAGLFLGVCLQVLRETLLMRQEEREKRKRAGCTG
jgi:predicted PurR-regulated permease PerM